MTAGYADGKVYTEDIRDADTGMVYSLVPSNVELDDIKTIDGKQYDPSRRHYTTEQLTDELQKYGLEIVHDSSEGFDELGSIVVITMLMKI